MIPGARVPQMYSVTNIFFHFDGLSCALLETLTLRCYATPHRVTLNPKGQRNNNEFTAQCKFPGLGLLFPAALDAVLDPSLHRVEHDRALRQRPYPGRS